MTGAPDDRDVPPEKWHALMVEMLDTVAQAFVSNGKPREQADLDAQTAVEAIYSTFRGNMVYVPFNTAAKTAMLHARIFAQFDGRNQKELARRHGISLQHVYRIIKQQREHNRNSKDETK